MTMGTKPDTRIPIWQKRLLRWSCFFLACVAVGFLLFRPVMWLVGQSLVVEQKPATVQVVWVVPEHDYRLEPCFAQALEWYQQAPQLQFVCVEQYPVNLVRERVIPPYHVRVQAYLTTQGVPADSIHVVSGSARNLLESGKSLREWMNNRPHAELTVMCQRFASRSVRSYMNRAFGNQKGRVHVYGAPDPDYGDDNWWKHRGAVKNWIIGATKLLFAWTRGSNESRNEPWNARRYERGLVDGAREADEALD